MNDTQEVDRQAVESLGYVRAVARTVKGRCCEYDDLVQEGSLALLLAFRKGENRLANATLLTFARKAVIGAMLDARAAADKAAFPPTELAGRQAQEPSGLPGAADLTPLLARLSEKERTAFEAVCFQGLSLTETAAVVGVNCKQHVRGLLAQAARHLRYGVEHPEFTGPLTPWGIPRKRPIRNRKAG